jgi:hypothetical protein
MAGGASIVAVARGAISARRITAPLVDNPPMRFEHLIEINDPGLGYLTPLTRAQVWAGLMHRVEDARPFLPGLDVCEIRSRGDDWVERHLDFGAVQLSDRATWVTGQSVRFDTAPGANHRGGRLTISIEEPETGHLFLRFAYQTEAAAGPVDEDAPYEEFLRQAYEAADMDTVSVIRLMAQPTGPAA